MPMVRSSRARTTRPPPCRLARRGSTCSSTMRIISRGTPGRQKNSARSDPRSTSSAKPGAVPIGLGSTSAPAGNQAWLSLLSVISRPTRAKKARMPSRASASR